MSNSIHSVGILGGRGMLGSDLVSFFRKRYDVTAIDTDNYESVKGSSFDLVVNANGNSRRFWGNSHPLEDFQASVASVYRSLIDFPAKKYVYISSIDVYSDHASPRTTSEEHATPESLRSPYGLHKYLAECVVRNTAPDWIILRASMMLGTSLRKGPLYDIVNGAALFVKPSSRFQCITTEAVAAIIETLIEKGIAREIFNAGGTGVFMLQDAISHQGRENAIRDDAQEQIYEVNVAKLSRYYALESSERYLKRFFELYHG